MSHPFDGEAIGYDADFTHTRLGLWLRETVWQQLADAFQPTDHLLELGCGTGEDALWLASQGRMVTATDASAGMLAVARRKAEQAGLAERIHFAQLDLGISNLELGISRLKLPNSKFEIPDSRFDGAFSNFGVLNCLAERRRVAQALARWVRPGGQVVLVLMGPFCPWEMAWYLMHGQLANAGRRFRAGVKAQLADGASIRVWYPSPRRLAAEFHPRFRVRRLLGVGVALPPSYLSHLVDRWPGLFQDLARWDRRLGSWWPWTWLNDHYLMILERDGKL